MENKFSAPTSTSSAAESTATTYVQADPGSFRDLVQRLTGAGPTTTAAIAPRHKPFKLHDRRSSTVGSLDVIKSKSAAAHRSTATASKSPTPSPVTPLVSGPLFSPQASVEEEEEEERVIKEKGFYLRRSPRVTTPPELLTLFPLCSPRE